jgi:uncharacterized membrane protein
MTEIDQLIAEALRQQDEIQEIAKQTQAAAPTSKRLTVPLKAPVEPVVEPKMDLDSHGWEVARAAMKARDSYKAQAEAAMQRESELQDDLSRLRNTVAQMQNELKDERLMVDVLSKSLKNMARRVP